MADYSPPGSGAGPSGPRAGFGERLVAVLLDGLLTGLANLFLRALFGPVLGVALALALAVAYYVYFEGSTSGQTPGKRALGIRVVDSATGGPVGLSRAAIRYAARIVSALPCGLGYFWMLWDSERQTWHDKAAASLVVPVSAYPVAAWPG